MKGNSNTVQSYLSDHLFRNEYGKMVSVITRYIGTENVLTAEDIVQEALLKASVDWELKGIPPNPTAWLYKTAKNLTFNILKRKKLESKFKISHHLVETDNALNFEDEAIQDDQLRMMFVCCHPSISEKSQVALILKILCGFSISEIANAFFTNNEVINKRLVRGRKKLREEAISFDLPENINTNLTVVLKTIYLLFNESYLPSSKNEIIRYDFCLEAVRLLNIILDSDHIQEKNECHALLALMLFNASRFEARANKENAMIEMEMQDRSLWNQDLINSGVWFLDLAIKGGEVSKYLLLATISANYCVAKSFDATNWEEICALYDRLLIIENSPIIHLNKSVALSKAKNDKVAIQYLLDLKSVSDINKFHLYHSTLASFYEKVKEIESALFHYQKALQLAKNDRDKENIRKKIEAIVPNPKPHLL